MRRIDLEGWDLGYRLIPFYRDNFIQKIKLIKNIKEATSVKNKSQLQLI